MNTSRDCHTTNNNHAKFRGRNVPYYSQWESHSLIQAIIQRTATAMDDVLWAQSGAPDLKTYAEWSGHLCGIACLRMILAAYEIPPPPAFSLAMRAKKFGAYVEAPDGIKGLIYQPFIEMLKADYGITGRTFVHKSVEDLKTLKSQNDFVITSVHHTIRSPHYNPPSKGGHLVLIHDQSARGEFIFHNPSGDTPESQQNAVVQSYDFERFFAGRGITIQMEN